MYWKLGGNGLKGMEEWKDAMGNNGENKRKVSNREYIGYVIYHETLSNDHITNLTKMFPIRHDLNLAASEVQCDSALWEHTPLTEWLDLLMLLGISKSSKSVIVWHMYEVHWVVPKPLNSNTVLPQTHNSLLYISYLLFDIVYKIFCTH